MTTEQFENLKLMLISMVVLAVLLKVISLFMSSYLNKKDIDVPIEISGRLKKIAGEPLDKSLDAYSSYIRNEFISLGMFFGIMYWIYDVFYKAPSEYHSLEVILLGLVITTYLSCFVKIFKYTKAIRQKSLEDTTYKKIKKYYVIWLLQFFAISFLLLIIFGYFLNISVYILYAIYYVSSLFYMATYTKQQTPL